MINIDALDPDTSYLFLVLFIIGCAAVILSLGWLVASIVEKSGRPKAGLAFAFAAVLTGAMALPTFLHEVPNNQAARAAAVQAEADARAVIVAALQERYEVEDAVPGTHGTRSCGFLTCTDREEMSWADVAEKATSGTAATETTISVVLPDGQVVGYGLMFDNDTGVATLLQSSGGAPIPGELMK